MSPGRATLDGVFDSNETGKLTITLKNTGDQHLSATTATITTTSPNVTIANGGNLSFLPRDPFNPLSSSIGVSMTGPDILLQNTATNHVALWKTDGTTLLYGVVVASPLPNMKLITDSSG